MGVSKSVGHAVGETWWRHSWPIFSSLFIFLSCNVIFMENRFLFLLLLSGMWINFPPSTLGPTKMEETREKKISIEKEEPVTTGLMPLLLKRGKKEFSPQSFIVVPAPPWSFFFTLVEGDPKREPQAWLDTIQRDSFRFSFFYYYRVFSNKRPN